MKRLFSSAVPRLLHNTRTMAKIVSADQSGLALASKTLHDGGCVSFPTETVYGLGANALNVDAILQIFEYKGRPHTDPLIVHVASTKAAKDIVQVNELAEPIFECLTSRFWPGPLTLVLPAKPCVPAQISANTGFVGVRFPQHPIARALLETCQLPVAAPSANRFGHVSPTTAAHVAADLGDHPIVIVQGESEKTKRTDQETSDDGSVCNVGIESTVLKIIPEESSLLVYRRGGVSAAQLRAALDDANLHHIQITFASAPVYMSTSLTQTTSNNESSIAEGSSLVTHDQSGHDDPSKGLEAPGQLLRHYAPDVDTYLLPRDRPTKLDSLPSDALRKLEHAVLIDFGGQYNSLAQYAASYTDLSTQGDVFEARRHVYAALRASETVPGAVVVLLAQPTAEIAQSDLSKQELSDHLDALSDRLYRAATGRWLATDAVSPEATDIWKSVFCEV